MKVLIIGCGYVGKRFAEEALSRGWEVCALTRSDERAAQFFEKGITPVVGNVLDANSLNDLQAADLCLYAVGYDRSASDDKRDVYITGLENVLAAIHENIPRLIYVSSTSVYGESNGSWVNEKTDPNPANDSGKICLAAEEVVRKYYPTDSNEKLGTIIRLSGIYGPDRLIGRKEQLREGQPIPGNPQGWLNLIHVDDILQALFKIADSAVSAPLYLLSDTQPNRRIEFYSELAKHLGTPPPVMNDAPTENLGKRCDSALIRSEFGLELLRPTIREGIPASIS